MNTIGCTCPTKIADEQLNHCSSFGYLQQILDTLKEASCCIWISFGFRFAFGNNFNQGQPWVNTRRSEACPHMWSLWCAGICMAAPSKYSWHRCRLQDASGNSVVILRASDNQGAVFLGLRQVWKLFSSPSLSYGSFSSRAAQCGKLYPTSPMDRVRMFRLGAIGTHASAAKLASLTTALKTLRWFSCSVAMQQRIQGLRDMPWPDEWPGASHPSKACI